MKREESGKAPALTALVGPVAFYAGLLIAIIASLATPSGLLYIVLGVIGAIVGFLNITAKETGPFLFSSIAFIVAVLGMAQLVLMHFPGAVEMYPVIFQLATNLVVLIGAGAMVISLRAVYELAKRK